jgi:pimeloyl-ACP methyl ester carboxylesterase
MEMKDRTMTPKRSTRLLVVLALLAALLPACMGKEAPITVPAGAQAGDLVGLQSCTYEANKVKYDADCGTLVVPENRGNPGSRLIALPVIRVHALNDSPAEPIFFLQGGPGVSNLEHQHLVGLVDDHDFVQVGYRGIEGSSVLDCPETVDALKAADDMLDQAALEGFHTSIAACAERLRGEGVDLAGYTLFERIDDMETARVALGYERINLLSESVGTRTGLFYSQAYPDSIHRSALIAVNPPGHFLWKAEVIDGQLEEVAELCAQDAGCSARTGDLAETMHEVARDMPARWLFLPIRPGTVKLGSFFGMFETSTAPMSAPVMIDAWLSAAEGDASGLAMITFFAKMVFPSAFVWGETAATGSIDVPVALAYLAEANLGDSILGTPGSTWMFGGLSAWPASPPPQKALAVEPSDVETLMLSGTLDFSTPPQFARDEVLPWLSKGQQVILPGFGHSGDVWGVQPEATAHLLTRFYATGVADDSLYTDQPVDFKVGLGFPEMAKLLVAVSTLIVLLVVAAVWFVIARRRKRRA